MFHYGPENDVHTDYKHNPTHDKHRFLYIKINVFY